MKIDVMTKDKDIKTVVPALRFPEFRDGEGWKRTPILEICEIIGGGTPTSSNDVYWNGDIPWISSSDINENNISEITPTRHITKDAIKNSATKLCKAPSIHIVSRVGVGKVAFSRVDICTSQDFTNLCNINCNYIFLSYLLSIIMKQKVQETQGTSIKGIASAEIKNLHVPLPEIEEQQRIADCLSSLDDLISAVADKIETLKEYKKGLMQQLFPAEGKTIPAIRFPEFQNAGEWEVDNEFSQYIKLYRGSSPRPIKEYLTQDIDGVNWIKIGDTKSSKNYIINNVEEKITQKGSTKSRYVYQGELILANSMSFGKTYLLEVEGCIYDGWFVLREYENNYYKPFLLHLLNSEYMQNQYLKLSAGGIVLNISSDIVYQTKLPHTSIDEQQKIADCLSSVDELISTETAKLDQLKKHKKGLMQQLFPKLQ